MKLKRGDIKMKIEEQVLSREQMKHLQELGVDTSDASMAYYNISRDNQPDKWILGIANKEVATVMLSNGLTEMEPTYTIGDLIEKLPLDVGDYGEFGRHILIDGKYMEVGYENGSDHCPCMYYNTPLLELLYNTLCWVAENHKELIK